MPLTNRTRRKIKTESEKSDLQNAIFGRKEKFEFKR